MSRKRGAPASFTWLEPRAWRAVQSCWGGLRGLDAGKHRARAAAPLDQNCESDGGEHEDDGGPGRHFGQKVGCSAGSERGLRPLAAKGAGEVSTLTLLEKNHPDQDDANDNVDGTDKPDHLKLNLILIGAEGGT